LVETNVPRDAVDAAPGSLFARARRRAESKFPPLKSAIENEVGDHVPTTASGTPMAWMTPMPSAAPRRRWPWIAGAAAVVIAGGLVFIQPWSSDDSATPHAAAQ